MALISSEMYSWNPDQRPEPVNEQALDFLARFGIIEHGRPGASMECIAGYNVDRALLDLILESRVS